MEHGIADFDLVSRREQLRRVDPRSIDVGAIGGAEVLDQDPTLVRKAHTGMLARQRRVTAEVGRGVGGPPENQFAFQLNDRPSGSAAHHLKRDFPHTAPSPAD